MRSEGTIHTLTIRKVAWNEGGEYKCLADGGAKTSATLIVKGNDRDSNSVSGSVVFRLAIPVTFTKNLEERVCNFGEPVEFTCETSKACRVEWSVGDKRLSPSQVEIESVENRHTLRLPKAKLTDKGWYKCAVQDAFTEAKLIVIGKTNRRHEETKNRFSFS